MSKKVVLCSFFDSNNLGDLLISETIEQNINNRLIEHEIIKYDLLTIRKIDNEYKKTNTNFKEHKILNSEIKLILQKFFPKLPSKKFLLANKNNFAAFEKDIAESDALVIAGGNMLMDLSSVWPTIVLEYVKKAKKYNKPIIISSVGVGPINYKFNEKMIRKIVKMVDYFSVRDEQSYELTKKIIDDNQLLKKVSITVDPVFSSNSIKQNSEENNKISRNNIGICFLGKECFSTTKEFELYANSIKKTIKKLNENTFFIFSTEQMDYLSIKSEFSDVNSSNFKIVNINTINDLNDLYKKLTFLIGGRMHAMIIAHVANLPHFGLKWQGKLLGYSEITGTKIYDISDFVYSKIILNLNNNLRNLNEKKVFISNKNKELKLSISKEMEKIILIISKETKL